MPDVPIFFPPGELIFKIPYYHGERSVDEIEQLLRDEPDDSYILVNFDTTDIEGRHFTKVSINKKKVPIFQYSGVYSCFNPWYLDDGYKNFHPMKPENFNDHKKYQCSVNGNPILIKKPRSLKELTRAVICKTFNYKDLEQLKNQRTIPLIIWTYLCNNYMLRKPNYTVLYCFER